MAKKLKERMKRIDFGALPYYATIIVTNDIPASIIKHRLPDPRDSTMKACVFSGPNSNLSVMFLPRDADMNTIVHEATHVIWNLFSYTEIKLDTELLAYYIGFLSDEISKFLKTQVKAKSLPKACQVENLPSTV